MILQVTGTRIVNLIADVVVLGVKVFHEEVYPSSFSKEVTPNKTNIMPKNNKPKEEPAHRIRFGRIQASVWGNDTDQGVRYNTTFSRSYKDGEEWKHTDSFGRDDLLVIAEAARQAYLWIHEQRSSDEGKAAD